jgi:phenylpropionate dioxygenase-like ring-hydroxylating dioxygenase large terminal subunit
MARTSDSVALNDWYVVATVGHIKPNTRMKTLLLGQPLEIASDASGQLSCFELEDDGDKRRIQHQRELYGFLWVSLGTPARDIVAIPEFEDRERRVIRRGVIGVATSAQRVIENFIDLSHFSFVHTGTLGGLDNAEVPKYNVEYRQDGAELWATECRFFQPKASAATNLSKDVLYDYRIPSPFIAIIYKDSLVRPGKKDLIGLFLQPTEEIDTIVHSFALVHDEVNTDTHILHFYHEIFGQDRGVMIHQTPKRLPVSPRRDIPTLSDASSIAYRRWLDKSGLEFGLDRNPG